MAATGSWPVCLRLIVNSLHDAGTVIEPTSNCMASLPSMVVLQLLTTASGLPPAAAVSAPAAGGVLASGAGVAAGAGISAAGAAGSVTGAGVVAGASGAAEGGADWSPQAASASAHAKPRPVVFMFMADLLCRWPRHHRGWTIAQGEEAVDARHRLEAARSGPQRGTSSMRTRCATSMMHLLTLRHCTAQSDRVAMDTVGH